MNTVSAILILLGLLLMVGVFFYGVFSASPLFGVFVLGLFLTVIGGISSNVS